ncbi:MAG: WXG100 family type VII secretion target [Lachnospiraceae bacterium]|nr:WXG100 family type VII secretion target [Lachnospiraceae bacterium]
MSYFQVTAAELKHKAEELKGLNSHFQTQTESLKSTEEALRIMWEGEANNSFHSAFLRDKSRMDSFRQAIEQYVTALMTIASKYEEAEARNVATAMARTG